MKRVPFAIIVAAKNGDSEAIDFIFRHFEGYIAKRCLVTSKDDNGISHTYVDEDLRYQAEIAIYNAIKGFQFQEPPATFNC